MTDQQRIEQAQRVGDRMLGPSERHRCDRIHGGRMNARPRVRATTGDLAAGPWLLDFGDGITAVVTADRSDPRLRIYRWTLWGQGLDQDGESQSERFALLELCCRVAAHRPPPGLDMSELEIQRLVRRAESSAAEAVAVLRDLLLRRTGSRWSVRRGRGSRAEEITIKAPPKRCTGGSMSHTDAVTLAAVTGQSVVSTSAGVRVASTRGRRAEIVKALAGQPSQIGVTACG